MELKYVVKIFEEITKNNEKLFVYFQLYFHEKEQDTKISILYRFILVLFLLCGLFGLRKVTIIHILSTQFFEGKLLD